MREAVGSGDIDRHVHAGSPRSRGERLHNTGRAEDGNAVHYAESRIVGLLRDLLAAGNGDFDDERVTISGFQHRLSNETPRHAGYGRVTYGNPRARPGDSTNALAATQSYFSAIAAILPDPGAYLRARSYIGVVSAIFYDRAGCTGYGVFTVYLAAVNLECGILADGQANCNLAYRLARKQRNRCGFCCSGGACARRVAGSHPATLNGRTAVFALSLRHR